jgi:hypothetical protein
MNDIFTIANTHFEKFRKKNYDSFIKLLNSDEGKSFIKFKSIKNSEELVLFIEQNYEKYISSMKDGINLMINVLKNYNLSFRIYDIDDYEDTAECIVCIWKIQNKDYLCGIFFDKIYKNPYLNISCVEHNVVINNDFILDAKSPLPEWFVNGLKNSYC